MTKQKQLLERLQDGIEQAITALEELERAITDGNERKIGAALYLLGYELNQLQKDIDHEACLPSHRQALR